MSSWLRAAAAMAGKDLAMLLRNPLSVVANLVPPIGLLVVLGGVGLAASRVPVALAPLGDGPYTRALVELAHTFSSPTSPYFDVRTTDPQTARAAFDAGRVLAVVEIPADFDSGLAAGRGGVIRLHLHNVHADQAKNYRQRADLLAWEFNHRVLPESLYPVRVNVAMRERLPQEIPFAHVLAAGVVPLAILLGGILGGGFGAAREWEGGTARLLLLAPASRLALVAGMLAAGLAEGAFAGAVLLALGIFWFGLPVAGPPGLIALAGGALAGFGVSLGTLVGVTARRIQPVVAFAIFFSVLSWAFGGGMVLMSLASQMMSPAVLAVSRYNPASYGVDLLVRLINLGHSPTLGRDLAVLVASSATVVAVAGLALRRLAEGGSR